jgi:hypothetical protein
MKFPTALPSGRQRTPVGTRGANVRPPRLRISRSELVRGGRVRPSSRARCRAGRPRPFARSAIAVAGHRRLELPAVPLRTGSRRRLQRAGAPRVGDTTDRPKGRRVRVLQQRLAGLRDRQRAEAPLPSQARNFARRLAEGLGLAALGTRCLCREVCPEVTMETLSVQTTKEEGVAGRYRQKQVVDPRARRAYSACWAHRLFRAQGITLVPPIDPSLNR